MLNINFTAWHFDTKY